jgi:adenylate cyclase
MVQSAASILVVDDSLDCVRLLGNMLSEQGYRVRKVLNGQMALTATQAAPPDLILLDITMPEFNGYEVCRHLKSNPQTRDIPVIFISALNEVLDKAKAFAVGGADYIVKPFQFEEVINRVDTQLQLKVLNQTLSLETDRALRAETDYQRLFTNAPCGICHLTPEGLYIRVNPALARLYGYESPAAMLAQLAQYPQPLYADPYQWEILLSQLEQQGSLDHFQSQIKRPDGSILAVTETIYAVVDAQQTLLYYENWIEPID